MAGFRSGGRGPIPLLAASRACPSFGIVDERESPEWDPRPVIRKVRVYIRRLKRTRKDLLALMEEIPRPTWQDRNDLLERRAPLSVPAQLLAVVEDGVDRLTTATTGLRQGVHKNRFKEHERYWRAGLGPDPYVMEYLDEALDRLESLDLERQAAEENG